LLETRLQKSLFEILASIHIQRRKISTKGKAEQSFDIEIENLVKELNKNIQIKEGIESSFRASQQQRKTLIMVLQKLYMTMQTRLNDLNSKFHAGTNQTSSPFLICQPTVDELKVAGGMLKMGDRYSNQRIREILAGTDVSKIPTLKHVLLENLLILPKKMKLDKQIQTQFDNALSISPAPHRESSISRDKKTNFDKYVKGILLESRSRRLRGGKHSTSSSQNYSHSSQTHRMANQELPRPKSSIADSQKLDYPPPSGQTAEQQRPRSQKRQQPSKSLTRAFSPKHSAKQSSAGERANKQQSLGLPQRTMPRPATVAAVRTQTPHAAVRGLLARHCVSRVPASRSDPREYSPACYPTHYTATAATNSRIHGARSPTGARTEDYLNDPLSRAERVLEKMLGREKINVRSKQTLESCQSSEGGKDVVNEMTDEPRVRQEIKGKLPSVGNSATFSFSGQEARQSLGLLDKISPRAAGACRESISNRIGKAGTSASSSTIAPGGLASGLQTGSRRTSSGVVILSNSRKGDMIISTNLVPTSPNAGSSLGNYSSFFSSRRKSKVTFPVTNQTKLDATKSPIKAPIERLTLELSGTPTRLFGRMEELSAIQNLLEEPTEEDFIITPLPLNEPKMQNAHELSLVARPDLDERTSHNLKQLANIFQKEGFSTDFVFNPVNCERKLNFESCDMISRSGTPYLDILKGSSVPVEMNLNIAEFNQHKREPANFDISRDRHSMMSQVSQSASNQARIEQANKRLNQAKESSLGRMGSGASRSSSRQVASPRYSEGDVVSSLNIQGSLAARAGTSDSTPFYLPPENKEWDSCKKPFADFLAQDQTSLLKLSRSFDVESIAGQNRENTSGMRFSRKTNKLTIEESDFPEVNEQNALSQRQKIKNTQNLSDFLTATLQQASNPFKGLSSAKQPIL
jgi:hypothetical protein